MLNALNFEIFMYGKVLTVLWVLMIIATKLSIMVKVSKYTFIPETMHNCLDSYLHSLLLFRIKAFNPTLGAQVTYVTHDI